MGVKAKKVKDLPVRRENSSKKADKVAKEDKEANLLEKVVRPRLLEKALSPAKVASNPENLVNPKATSVARPATSVARPRLTSKDSKALTNLNSEDSANLSSRAK